MADIRELIMLDPGLLDPRPETGLTRRLQNVKMSLRRWVVRSARVPILRRLYLAIYKAHGWMVVGVARRFAGTDAVYLTNGTAGGDVQIGVSDVDVAIFGHWPEALQFRLMKIFGAMVFFSPLLDRGSIGCIGTVEDMRNLCATDLYFAFFFAMGRGRWKLLYGRDVLPELPEVEAERWAGCVYTSVRRWWSMIVVCALGDDVTGRDAIFRNSICFKTVAETLRAERMLRGAGVEAVSGVGRGALVAAEYQRTGEPLAGMLAESERRQFVGIARDPRVPTFWWALQRAERFHAAMRAEATFQAFVPFRVEGAASERMVAEATRAHAEALVACAVREWPEMRAAWLVPGVSRLALDSVVLLFEGSAGRAPSVEVLRRLRAMHLGVTGLPQRVNLFLLCEQAAYQFDVNSAIDFAHDTLTPETAPDVFLAMSLPEFLVYGEVSAEREDLRWSYFAQELAAEELMGRRGAFRRFGVVSRPSDLENLRNFWRYAQLLVMERSALAGEVLLPRTVAAVRRGLEEWVSGSLAVDLAALEEAYRKAVEGAAHGAKQWDAVIERAFAGLVAVFG